MASGKELCNCSGRLQIFILRGRGLTNTQLIGKQDPYVEVYVDMDKLSKADKKKAKKKTHTHNNGGTDPVWATDPASAKGQPFVFDIAGPETAITFLLRDEEGRLSLGGDPEIGRAIVPIRTLVQNANTKGIWYEVTRVNGKRTAGHIEVVTRFDGTDHTGKKISSNGGAATEHKALPQRPAAAVAAAAAAAVAKPPARSGGYPGAAIRQQPVQQQRQVQQQVHQQVRPPAQAPQYAQRPPAQVPQQQYVQPAQPQVYGQAQRAPQVVYQQAPVQQRPPAVVYQQQPQVVYAQPQPQVVYAQPQPQVVYAQAQPQYVQQPAGPVYVNAQGQRVDQYGRLI